MSTIKDKFDALQELCLRFNTNIPAVMNDSLTLYEAVSKIAYQSNTTYLYVKDIADTVEGYKDDAEASATTVSESLTNATSILEQTQSVAEEFESDILDINTTLSSQRGDILTLQHEVSSLVSGTPIPVSTVAEMTDTTKIYLYAGNETGYVFGNWYYYGDDSWVEGGTYGDAGINRIARQVLLYILQHIEYTASGMEMYINNLMDALSIGTIRHTITYNLTNATSSSIVTEVNDQESYSTSVLPNSGYTFTSFTVTMGGEDITSTARALYSPGEISIASVTGNVVITATAVTAPHSYTLGTNLEKLNGGTYCQEAGGLFVNTGTMLTKRRTLLTESGETCARTTSNYSDLTTYVDTEYFPIPVPLDATGVTITWAPTTNYIEPEFLTYDSTTYPYYTRVTSLGWTTGGTYSYAFEAGIYDYLMVTFKRDSGGNIYTGATDISAVTITFTTE